MSYKAWFHSIEQNTGKYNLLQWEDYGLTILHIHRSFLVKFVLALSFSHNKESHRPPNDKHKNKEPAATTQQIYTHTHRTNENVRQEKNVFRLFSLKTSIENTMLIKNKKKCMFYYRNPGTEHKYQRRDLFMICVLFSLFICLYKLMNV